MRDFDNEDERPEPKPKRYISCRDRMCGASDCPKCSPHNFRGGVFIADIEEAESNE